MNKTTERLTDLQTNKARRGADHSFLSDIGRGLDSVFCFFFQFHTRCFFPQTQEERAPFRFVRRPTAFYSHHAPSRTTIQETGFCSITAFFSACYSFICFFFICLLVVYFLLIIITSRRCWSEWTHQFPASCFLVGSRSRFAL